MGDGANATVAGLQWSGAKTNDCIRAELMNGLWLACRRLNSSFYA